jgi:hypothetical protein
MLPQRQSGSPDTGVDISGQDLPEQAGGARYAETEG